ncbi:MAG: hypothetical protein WBB37_11470 [bacterium]
MLKRIVLVVISLFTTVSLAQAPDTLWTKTYGGLDYDYGESVQQTFDGGYIVAGFTFSFGAGYDDVYLIKTDSLGDTLWTKTYGGSLYDAGLSILQTNDSGYIIIGGADMTGGGGSGKVYICRTNSSGDTLWTRKYTLFGNDRGNALAECYIGSMAYVIGALAWNDITHSFDMWLLKINNDGDTIWTKTYGGSGVEDCYSVKQTSDGGYILVGLTTSYGAGGIDAYVIKTDSFGNALWSRTYGSTQDDWAQDVEECDNGGYIIVGGTNSFGNDYQVYIVRTDANGDTLWTKTIGGDDVDTGQSIVTGQDGCAIIVGTAQLYGAGNRDVYILKIDSLGSVKWSRAYGGSQYEGACSINPTSDNGYIVCGDIRSWGAGEIDIWLLRISPDTLGITELERNLEKTTVSFTTIFSGSLVHLLEGKDCRVFDITGRTIVPERMKPGIYFVEIDGVITQKVVKIR